MIGGVTLNHLSWAALGGGMCKKLLSIAGSSGGAIRHVPSTLILFSVKF